MTSTQRTLVAMIAATLTSIIPASSVHAQSISSASASTAGSTGNGGDSDGSRLSSVNIQVNNGSQFKTRFAWNVSADVGVFSTRDQSGNAQHNLSFNVTAPGAYFLTVDTQRTGDMNRRNDASGCDGSADISGVSGSQSGGTLTSGTLSLGDPGSIGNGGSTTSGPINQSASARIDDVSNGVAQGHSLSFTWNGNARSNSCEAAVRLGEGSSVSGCDACAYPGSPSRTATSDGHFVTVTLTSLCGNGVVDSGQGEQCDTAISGSVCCNSQCKFTTSGTQCRASAGICDVAENCTGSSATCPSNGFVSSSVVCRAASGGVCDAAENCTGSSAACPPDVFLNSSVTCRPSAGVCDVAESCSGSSASCPANAFQSNSVTCRPSAGICDSAETCTGSGAACPANTFVANTTVCRGAAGVCDAAENCTGSGAACPADSKSTAVCRAAGGFCDVAEVCDGVTNNCPADAVEPATTVCRPGAGVCDLAETCDGNGIFCPPDVKSTDVCRPVGGVCDTEETCDGVADDCPTDAFQPSSVECRATAGVCDVAESCSGAAADCPADAVEPATTVCRPDAGDCDVEDTCDGTNVACPADTLENDDTSCSDSNMCTLDDVCVAGVCTGNSMLCGDGTLQDGCGEQCDDSNLDANDGCSPTCQVEPGLGCTAGPLSGCRLPFVPAKASIQFVKKGGSKDQIKWKWLKGERTTTAEYGTPLTTTNYQLCIYDQTGLRFDVTMPAGGTCAGKPCWKASGGKGFQYKDKDLTPDGGAALKLKEGALAKAQIQFQGRGSALAMPDLSTLVQPLRVQIQQTDGLCWEAVYSGPPTTQSPTKFSDKAD
jgi:cysteine-rich repeat protein